MTNLYKITENLTLEKRGNTEDYEETVLKYRPMLKYTDDWKSGYISTSFSGEDTVKTGYPLECHNGFTGKKHYYRDLNTALVHHFELILLRQQKGFFWRYGTRVEYEDTFTSKLKISTQIRIKTLMFQRLKRISEGDKEVTTEDVNTYRGYIRGLDEPHQDTSLIRLFRVGFGYTLRELSEAMGAPFHSVYIGEAERDKRSLDDEESMHLINTLRGPQNNGIPVTIKELENGEDGETQIHFGIPEESPCDPGKDPNHPYYIEASILKEERRRIEQMAETNLKVIDKVQRNLEEFQNHLKGSQRRELIGFSLQVVFWTILCLWLFFKS